MSTYTQQLVHIVFATKDRRPALEAEHRRDLLAYINGTSKGLDCRVIRINCVHDHVHVLVDLHPTVSVSEYVRAIKLASGKWMRESGRFPSFEKWQEGYGAFSVSREHRDRVVEYIKNQEEHHRSVSFVEELRRVVEELGLAWDDRFLP